MILVLNVCKERLHYYEFVKPVEDILRKKNIEFETFHYKQINDRILARVDKVIICGTSLADDEFLKDVDRFKDMFRYFDLHNKDVSVLGICAGFQILGMMFGGEVKKKTEIGFFREKFGKEFLGLRGEVEVYHLHNNYIEFFPHKAKGSLTRLSSCGKRDEKVECQKWDVFSCGEDGIIQAVKLKGQDFYGVLFHPEVRNKEMILRFVEL